MLFGPIFSYFDPQDGKVPDEFGDEFGRVASRARQMLAQRGREQIVNAAETIDAMLEATAGSHRSHVLETLAESPAHDEAHGLFSRYDSPAGSLEWCIGRIDPGEVMGAAPWPWSQLFAVLALALIAHGCEERQYLESRNSQHFHELVERQVGAYAVDAMEAIAKAEALQRVEELEADFERRVSRMVSDRVSTRNAKAAKQRHAPVNRLKHEFIRWYEGKGGAQGFRSRADAARRFLEGLPPDKRRYLSAGNGQRTLLDALRDHLRTQPEA